MPDCGPDRGKHAVLVQAQTWLFFWSSWRAASWVPPPILCFFERALLLHFQQGSNYLKGFTHGAIFWKTVHLDDVAVFD